MYLARAPQGLTASDFGDLLLPCRVTMISYEQCKADIRVDKRYIEVRYRALYDSIPTYSLSVGEQDSPVLLFRTRCGK